MKPADFTPQVTPRKTLRLPPNNTGRARRDIPKHGDVALGDHATEEPV